MVVDRSCARKGTDGVALSLSLSLTYVDSGCGRHWQKNVGASRPLVGQRNKRRKRQCAGRAIDVN